MIAIPLDMTRALLGAAAAIALSVPGAPAAHAGQCPGSGSCCVPHANPGCSNTACCNLVCGADPFCCEVEWDQICAGAACAQCSSCDCAPDCTVACQPGDVPEGETCGASVNDGCNGTPPAFGAVTDEQTICGKGWAAGGVRDTDWFDVLAPNLATAVTANLASEFNGVCYVLDGLDACDPVVLGEPGAAARCAMAQRARAVVPPGQYALFVAPAAFDGVPCGSFNDYRVTVTIKCIGDTNETGVVNVVDLVHVILLWATPGLEAGVDADVNDDGTVDIEDLLIVIRDWGPCVM
jgi:hypothetical protein